MLAVSGLRGEDLLVGPADASCASARVLYIHGGSWTGGGPTEWGYDVLASKLAWLSGAVVMVPEHALLVALTLLVSLGARL